MSKGQGLLQQMQEWEFNYYDKLISEDLDKWLDELSKQKKEEERRYIISMNYISAIDFEIDTLKRFGKVANVKRLRELHRYFEPGYIYTMNAITGWSKEKID